MSIAKTLVWVGIFLLTGISTRAQNNLDYADPTIGNVGALLQPTRPTVQLPHQMIRMYPTRKDYIDDQIADFPLIIVSHRLGQAFSIKPSRSGIGAGNWDHLMAYDQGAEITRPWYYSTYLLDDDVAVEFTAGKKTGIYRFAFDGKGAKNLLLGTYNPDNSRWRFPSASVVTGMETYHGDIKVYMYGQFNVPGEYGILKDGNVLAGSDSIEGKTARAWIRFPQTGPDTIEFRYAISYISPAQAQRNFEEELTADPPSGKPAVSFNSLKQAGENAWAKVLGQIRVEGGTEAQKRSFYTALYRCNERMVDITEDNQYYSGFDGKVHRDATRPFYVDDWIWDTYLALHPLRAILDPSLERNMLDSYVTMYDQLGWMPTFPVLFGDHACMNAFHSSIMILDDYRKGIRSYDPEKAYEGMRKNATEATMLPWRNGPAISLDRFYYTRGYYPALRIGEKETVPEVDPRERRQAVAVTLGASYDDWAVAQMAHELGKDSDSRYFMKRASNYRNLWNPNAGMFMPKDEEGNWIAIDPKFDGGSGGRDYYDENNGWTYLWQVQEDVKGLVNLMGGKDAFEARLDRLFRESLGRSKSDFWYKFPDATGLVGQYSMGNEPSFHIPYLYNFTNAPWKTQERVRLLLDLWFKDNVFGIPGDEDGGGMSAFVVFSSMGFYPVTPGLALYTIGSPVFEKVTIDLPNGHQFKVIAHGSSRVNKYIQSASFDGVPLDTPWFTHDQLVAGGTLELEMGPRPNKEWGNKPSLPSSSSLPSSAGAQVRMPSIFGDHMVLQGGIAVPVWGWGAPGEKVAVIFNGKTYTAVTGQDGKWALTMGKYPPGGPYEMTIRAGGRQVVFHDVLIGDVWLASGQSNMEFGIQTDSHAAESIPAATDSLIRFFYVPMAKSLEPQTDIGHAVSDSDGRWVVCSPSLLASKWAWHGFSAIGYYFARRLREATHGPVGVIGSYKGGTGAQAWMSLSGLKANPDFYHYIDGAHPFDVGFNTPATLFNAMIAPLIPYGIKGVIWYQGESNGDRMIDALEYKTLFPALIGDWRSKWGEGDFPFLYVQLPNFRAPAKTPSEGNWPWVREAQSETLSLPHTGMAVTIDIGDANNIHPTDKLDAGDRLALVARHLIYGEKIVSSGPIYDHMTVEGSAIRLSFRQTGGRLCIGTGSDTAGLRGFGIADADMRFVWGKATLSGNTVIVSSDQVPHPVAVRYDWADNPDGNLYNKEGLPSAPFRTDHYKEQGTSSAQAPRVTFTQPFAPSSDWVKPAEQPYRQDICLNGSWQFEPVGLPVGFKEGVDPVPDLPPAAADGWDKTPIRIPSPWNVNGFADKNGQGGDFRCFPTYPAAWENIKMGWLRKTFTLPADWKGKQLRLHFEAVAGDAEIFINGRPAGHHFGLFLPFDVDITSYVVFGKENQLTVGVRKASLFDRRGAYGRRTYQAGSFWGQHIAGVWQDVYVVALSDVRAADVYVKPLVDEDRLSAEVSVSNDKDIAQHLTVDGYVYKWMAQGVSPGPEPSTRLAGDASLEMEPITVDVPAHTTLKVILSAPVKGRLALWSPDQPNLYGLVIHTNAGGRTVDSKYVRFGWRQTTIKGNQFLLNGQPIVMKGDSWHFLGIPQMTRRYAWAWFTALHAAHLNAVRLHAEPYPSFYLDMADEMGILVLDETAVWASDGGPKLDELSFWKDTEQQLAEQVLRDRNHPSVFGWSASNEVKPIVRGVMRNPPGMMDRLDQYYSIWANLCHELDPTRPWVSCDGEDDGDGRLPVYIVHYGGYGAMDRAHASGKPWGVGEAGNAYYGTPEQVAGTNGDRAYESFLGRMEGVAASSYQSLLAQRDRGAIYRSVFNLVWYGLQPLPLGMKDTTRAPAPADGIYFTHFAEGEPGVQPERLGPYCTTLNPGYDPALPLYKTWPLFDAIRDASEEPPADSQRWVSTAADMSPGATAEPAPGAATPGVNVPLSPVTSVKVLAGRGSDLASALRRTGVPLDDLDKAEVPQVLFIDGGHPPGADARTLIDRVLGHGGAVMVWGVNGAELSALNRLLPEPLEVTSRKASSLLPVTPDAITTGITAADLYFSELRPPEIIENGLAGPLVAGSAVLLEACNTDWQQWNKQPEYAKTAMVLRSEREKKPSGVALIERRMGGGHGTGGGRLLVTTLSPAPRLTKAEKVIRHLLSNMGVPLGAGNDVGKPLLKDGDIVRVLLCGSFPSASLEEGARANFVDPSSGNAMRAQGLSSGKPWTLAYSESGQFDLGKLVTDGPRQDAVAYLSFWVSSPRALDDLLLEPNIPVVNMEVTADDAAQVWLNGKMIIGEKPSGTSRAEALKLRQGWNHFLIKVIQTGGGWQFSGRLTCSQPDFLAGLESALEKP